MANTVQTRFALFSGRLSTHTSDAPTLDEIVASWKEPPDDLRQAIEAMRREEDADRQNRIKQRLPAHAFRTAPIASQGWGDGVVVLEGDVYQRPSGRNPDHYEHHSGIICVDIDGSDDPEGDRDAVASLPWVVAAAISPRGRGVKALVAVPRVSDAATYKRQERRVEAAVGLATGRKTDAGAEGLHRIFYATHDPDAYYNPNAEPLREDPDVRWETWWANVQRYSEEGHSERNPWFLGLLQFADASRHGVPEATAQRAALAWSRTAPGYDDIGEGDFQDNGKGGGWRPALEHVGRAAAGQAPPIAYAPILPVDAAHSGPRYRAERVLRQHARRLLLASYSDAEEPDGLDVLVWNGATWSREGLVDLIEAARVRYVRDTHDQHRLASEEAGEACRTESGSRGHTHAARMSAAREGGEESLVLPAEEKRRIDGPRSLALKDADQMARPRGRRDTVDMFRQALGAMRESGLPEGLTVCTTDDLDADMRYIGAPNGVIDLDTGELLGGEAARAALVTHRLPDPYDPDAEHESVDRVFPESPPSDERRWLRSALAHALRNRPRREIIGLIAEGNAGKTTLVNMFSAALGPYSPRIGASAFTKRHFGDPSAHNGPLLSLGKPSRIAWVDEVKSGLDLRLLSEASGGALKISVRDVGKTAQNIEVSAHVVLAGNEPKGEGVFGLSDPSVDETPFLERLSMVPMEEIPKNERDEGLLDIPPPRVRQALVARIVRLAAASAGWPDDTDEMVARKEEQVEMEREPWEEEFVPQVLVPDEETSLWPMWADVHEAFGGYWAERRFRAQPPTPKVVQARVRAFYRLGKLPRGGRTDGGARPVVLAAYRLNSGWLAGFDTHVTVTPKRVGEIEVTHDGRKIVDSRRNGKEATK